jgi:hypothetical protein
VTYSQSAEAAAAAAVVVAAGVGQTYCLQCCRISYPFAAAELAAAEAAAAAAECRTCHQSQRPAGRLTEQAVRK